VRPIAKEELKALGKNSQKGRDSFVSYYYPRRQKGKARGEKGDSTCGIRGKRMKEVRGKVLFVETASANDHVITKGREIGGKRSKRLKPGDSAPKGGERGRYTQDNVLPPMMEEGKEVKKGERIKKNS